uniref:Uncharacterized protein n=1 Tax=Fagus sylvatica TaxID=28930 RepID=A0A2N9I4G4_FAGSY
MSDRGSSGSGGPRVGPIALRRARLRSLMPEAVGLASGAARPSSRPGITIIARSARPPLAHLASLLRRRQLLLLLDRRGRDLTALLFPRIPYLRTILHRGSDILLGAAFDRVILLLLRW